MSLQAQRVVDESRLEPWLRHVALVLASYADKHGGTLEAGYHSIRPKIRTLMRATGLKQSMVYRCLKALVDRQILIRTGWYERARCYRLDLARLAAYQPAPQVHSSGPVKNSTGPLQWNPQVHSSGICIITPDLKKDLNTYLLTCEVPVLPGTSAPTTASKPSKPPQAENDDDRTDERPTGTEERVAARVTALLDTFKALHLEHRGEAYRERTTDRAKAGDLVRDYDLPDLATMTRTMLTDPGDRWIAQSDRSLSVLHHKAKTLLAVVKPAARSQPRAGSDWDVVLDYLRGQLSTNDWYTWWRNPTRQLDSDGDVVTVEIDGVEERGWIERHYAAQLQDALKAAGLSRVEFVIARPAAVAKTG